MRVKGIKDIKGKCSKSKSSKNKDAKQAALKISAKDQKLLVVVGALVVVVAFGWFLLLPMWETHASLADEARTTSAQIEQALDTNATQGLMDSAAADDAATEKLLAGYPRTLDSAQVDRLTANMAKHYGFTIFSLGITAPEDGSTLAVYGGGENEKLELSGIERIDLSLTLDGSQASIQNFINKVESECAGVHIKSFNWIENADGKSWNLLCEMSVYTCER